MGKSAPEGKKYNFMDTYGDLVTLLLCFFVLLFAMSTVEEDKYNAFVEAMTQHFGAQPLNFSAAPSSSAPESDYGEDPPAGEVITPDPTLPADFEQTAEAIEEFIEENNLQGDIHVEVGESGNLYLRLNNALTFDGDSFALRTDALYVLDFFGETFVGMEDSIFKINFIGHTAEIAGSATNDWVLSCSRSGAVASYFEKTVGFSPFKMETTGYGRFYPIGDNGTPEGRAMNRRVDIVVINNDPDKLNEALAEAAAIYFPNDDTSHFPGEESDLPGYTLDQIDPRTSLEDLNLEGLDLTGLTAEEIDEFVRQLQQEQENQNSGS